MGSSAFTALKNELSFKIENTTIGMLLSLANVIADESITLRLSSKTFL